jgi:hypothetical protein
LLPCLAHRRLSAMLCTATRPCLRSTHLSAPIAPRWSPPSECKNAHRGLSGLCRSASAPTRSQVSIASGENPRCCTKARRTPLLPQGNLPEVTVSANRPVSGPPVIPISPFLAPYPAGTVQSYVNTLDTPYVCRYSRANSPVTGRNMMAGFAVGGFAGFAAGVAFVAVNVVGFPEAEIIEGGALAAGGGTWLFAAAVAEPGGSLAIGGLTGAALGGAGGFAAGLAISPAGCQ